MNGFIAVFDIGKTNKKMAIYDDRLNMVESAATRLPEITEGELRIEPVHDITEWYIKQLRRFSKKYTIDAISIAAQGASCVCIDSSGNVAVPPVAYTTDPGEEFHHTFFDHFGSIEEIQRTTGSAPMGDLLNIAQLLWFEQKTFPREFGQVDRILGFPQYFGYVLTGRTGAEPTAMGCHTFLWDYQSDRWSFVADRMGITGKLPSRLSRSWDVLAPVKPDIVRTTGLEENTIVTLGIHDSNSSLLPYLIKEREQFVLNSTGTWCAIMKPAESFSFNDDEIGKLVFYNLDVYGRPVKTSILLGGLEFESWSEIVKKINGESEYPPFDIELYRKIIDENNLFIFPGIVKGTGQFPDSKPRAMEKGKTYNLQDIRRGTIPDFFRDYKKAIAVLNLSIAVQTRVAMDRVGIKNGMRVYVEGGFQSNRDYCSLLTAIYPESDIFLSNMEDASAFGAALCGKAALQECPPDELADLFTITRKRVPKLPGCEKISSYIDNFLKLTS